MNARERGLRGVGTERLEWLAKLIMMNALAISTSLERRAGGTISRTIGRTISGCARLPAVPVVARDRPSDFQRTPQADASMRVMNYYC